MIGAAGKEVSNNSDLRLLFGVIDHYPLIVFLVTAVLTVTLQSSTASIGLGIGWAQAGLLPAVTVVPWVLGANLGITLTMMMAGWGSVEGQAPGHWQPADQELWSRTPSIWRLNFVCLPSPAASGRDRSKDCQPPYALQPRSRDSGVTGTFTDFATAWLRYRVAADR